MRKIGILGGTFDPIHCGHIVIARYALEQYDLEEVWFMTGGNPPHKRNSDVTDAAIRHKMVSLAIEGENGFIPFDYEVYKETYSYTAETLTELKEKYPDIEFYFIIGEDSLNDLTKWYRPDIIASKCIILTYPRAAGSDIGPMISDRSERLKADIRLISAPLMGVSSSEIRKRIADGRSVYGLVPDIINEYIKDNNLYRGAE